MLIKSEVRVAVFETMSSKTLTSIRQRLKIVDLFGPLGFEAAGSKAEGSISYHVSLKD